MAKKKAGQPSSPNILDYPDSMSLYERESLAAEAKLAADRKIRKRPKPSVIQSSPQKHASPVRMLYLAIARIPLYFTPRPPPHANFCLFFTREPCLRSS